VVNAVIVPEGDGRWTEYAGGYTDMLAQRGHDFSRASKPTLVKEPGEPKAAVVPALADTKPQAKRRLSFNEKHALETLPKAMAALHDKVRDLNARLEDHSLYARDRKAFDAATSALATAQAELAEVEGKWLELELLREEVEGK
jgi:ATP-binding cassette subfamily F protein uup